MKKPLRPRAAFVEWLNYIQDRIDFEEMQKDGMMDVYFAAMEFIGEVASNSTYNHFFEEDIQLVLYLSNHEGVTLKECAEYLSISIQQTSGRLNKLIKSGFAFSKQEKKERYYSLTPYGKKKIFEYVLENKDINETRRG